MEKPKKKKKKPRLWTICDCFSKKEEDEDD